MRIKELKLTNYRKFKKIDLSFTSGTNLIAGSNASGKTTLIEAIGFAIYGDLLMGADLLDVLRFGSDFCRIELSLSNSEEMKIKREVQKIGNSANQKIVLDGKEVKTSNLNKIEKMFADKELFFEIVSVSQLSLHNLLDMSQQRFRDIFSNRISPWNINRILDNSRSLQGYLRSIENLCREKIVDGEKVTSQYQSTVENLDALLTEKKNLTERFEDIEKEQSKLIEELSRKENELKEIRGLNKAIIEVLGHQQNFLKELKRCRLLNQKELPPSLHPRISKGLRNYIAKIDFLYDQTLELSNMLNNILEFGKEYEHHIERLDRDYSLDLTKNVMRKGETENRLNKISSLIHNYEQQKELMERTSKLLDKNRSEMERYKTLLIVEERLGKLARSFWERHFGYFLSKVTNRINQYLKNLEIDIRVEVKDERMHVLIDSNALDFNVLSGGERTLLNLLSRIALIKEMGASSLLILDDAVTFLDQKTTLKVFSFLVSLKNDFEQIIVTAHRKDIPVNFDNKIVLDD